MCVESFDSGAPLNDVNNKKETKIPLKFKHRFTVATAVLYYINDYRTNRVLNV